MTGSTLTLRRAAARRVCLSTRAMIGAGVAACISASTAAAQVAPPSAAAASELERRITAEMTSQNIPGIAVALMSNGRLLHVGTYGLADVENRVPVSDSSVWEIGSISKQFVAAATLMLAKEGKLDLDDPIHDYLTGLPGEWLGVTIRQLLTHTSGIPDYEEIQTYEAYRFRFTPDEIIRVAHSRPMDFEPGHGYYYSNTGYFLLSMIVERIEGRPLGDVLHDRIFAPLGMLQTRMADPEDIIPHRSSGYWVDRMGVELMNRDATQTSSTLAAGGLLSSVGDFAKWDAALRGSTLLDEAQKREMWTGMTLANGNVTGYGFAWDLRPFRGRPAVSHSGQVAGFSALFTRLMDDDVSFVILTNRYRINLGRIRDIVADAYFGPAQ